MDDIGKILKEARESKHLTLDDVSRETHILTRYLSAIEEGNYSIVPDRIYVIGIVRKYADFLGLDGSELVKNFIDSTNKSSKGPSRQTEKVSQHSAGINLRPLITIITSVVLIAAFAIFIYINPYKKLNLNLPPPTEPQKEQQQVENSPPEMPETKTPEPADKLVINLKFTGDCWIRARDANGNVLVEKKFTNGEEVTLEGTEITLRLGDPGNAIITLNGQELPPLGKPGMPVTKKFTLEDLNSQEQNP